MTFDWVVCSDTGVVVFFATEVAVDNVFVNFIDESYTVREYPAYEKIGSDKSAWIPSDEGFNTVDAAVAVVFDTYDAAVWNIGRDRKILRLTLQLF